MKSKVFALLFLLTGICSPAWSEVFADGEALAVFRVPEGAGMSAASLNVAESVGEIGASVAETYEALSEIENVCPLSNESFPKVHKMIITLHIEAAEYVQTLFVP